MTCPLLEYRRDSGDRSFDEPRAYCTAAARFVQPMRADVCNDRYDLVHDRDCEIYLAHTGGDESDDGPVENEPDGEPEGNGSDGGRKGNESDDGSTENESNNRSTEAES